MPPTRKHLFRILSVLIAACIIAGLAFSFFVGRKLTAPVPRTVGPPPTDLHAQTVHSPGKSRIPMPDTYDIGTPLDEIKQAYPGLDPGFFVSTFHVFFGAFEDFDHDRILFLIPNIPGHAKVLLNGKPWNAKPEHFAKLRFAGRFDEKSMTGTLPHEEQIGWWIPMESTDRLKVSVEFSHVWFATDTEVEGTLEATYDPDNEWLVDFHVEPSEHTKAKDPADVYFITRRPILQQIKKVLEKKDACILRFKGCFDLRILKSSGNGQPPRKYEPFDLFAFSVTSKIIPSYKNKQEVTVRELESDLENFNEAAMAAGITPIIRIHVGPKTDEKLIRSVLKSVTAASCSPVYIDFGK